MPLKVLVDENLSRSLTEFLKNSGFEAIDVRDVGLRGSTDKKILAWASQYGFIVLTEDAGFGSLAYSFSSGHSGIKEILYLLFIVIPFKIKDGSTITTSSLL